MNITPLRGAALFSVLFVMSAGAAHAAPDTIARAGQRLTESNLQLCDGGVRFWQAVSETRSECSAEYQGFETSYFIPDSPFGSAEVAECIGDLGEARAVGEVPLDALTDSNFYEGFNLWWFFAVQNGQTDAARDFKTANRHIVKLFKELARRGPDEIIVYGNTEYDGGQGDLIYVYDSVTAQLYFFGFSCG